MAASEGARVVPVQSRSSATAGTRRDTRAHYCKLNSKKSEQKIMRSEGLKIS
jgi:hypothetical protein